MNIDEVITKIGQDNLEKFMKFMNGQTVGISSIGTLDYYPQDVEAFIEGRKEWD